MPRKTRHRAKSLAEFIEQSGISQTALATLLGVTPSAISKMASGQRTPSLALAVRIADLTGVPVANLLAATVAA